MSGKLTDKEETGTEARDGDGQADRLCLYLLLVVFFTGDRVSLLALLTARFLTVMDFHFDQSSAMGQAVPSWPIALDATENRAEAEGFDDESDDDEAGGGPGRSRRVERNAREQRRSNRITGQ